jgi:hypothetical protein
MESETAGLGGGLVSGVRLMFSSERGWINQKIKSPGRIRRVGKTKQTRDIGKLL